MSIVQIWSVLRNLNVESSELMSRSMIVISDAGCVLCFFFQAEDGIRDYKVTGVQTCALPICRRQQRPIVAAEVELLKDHVKEADAEGGLLFGAADFEPDALTTAEDTALALLRVTDGRTAFDTSGWGTPGHYPAWLPAYCAQSVTRDLLGQPRYELLESGQGGVIVERLRIPPKERRNA